MIKIINYIIFPQYDNILFVLLLSSLKYISRQNALYFIHIDKLNVYTNNWSWGWIDYMRNYIRSSFCRDYCSRVKLASISFIREGKQSVFDIDPDCLFGIGHKLNGDCSSAGQIDISHIK